VEDMITVVAKASQGSMQALQWARFLQLIPAALSIDLSASKAGAVADVVEMVGGVVSGS